MNLQDWHSLYRIQKLKLPGQIKYKIFKPELDFSETRIYSKSWLVSERFYKNTAKEDTFGMMTTIDNILIAKFKLSGTVKHRANNINYHFYRV